MRFDKFTIKSQEVIQNAQTLAGRHGNQQIEPVHLMAAMLDDKEGIGGSVVKKLGVSPDVVVREISEAIEKLPKVSHTGDTYLSPRTKGVLDAAFTEAATMKDEYVSIEHILLAIADEKKG